MFENAVVSLKPLIVYITPSLSLVSPKLISLADFPAQLSFRSAIDSAVSRCPYLEEAVDSRCHHHTDRGIDFRNSVSGHLPLEVGTRYDSDKVMDEVDMSCCTSRRNLMLGIVYLMGHMMFDVDVDFGMSRERLLLRR